MAFERSDDENLDAFSTHTQRHSLHGEGFSCPGASQNTDVGIFILAGIKNVCNYKAVIMLIYAKQDSIIVTYGVAHKRIAGGCAAGQDIPFGKLEQLLSRFISGRVDMKARS